MSRSVVVVTLAALVLAGAPLQSQAPAPRDTPPPNHPGTACHPEHWPGSRWPEDLRLMREAGPTASAGSRGAASNPRMCPVDLHWIKRAIHLAPVHGPTHHDARQRRGARARVPGLPRGPGGDRPMSNDEDVLIVVNQKDVAQQ